MREESNNIQDLVEIFQIGKQGTTCQEERRVVPPGDASLDIFLSWWYVDITVATAELTNAGYHFLK